MTEALHRARCAGGALVPMGQPFGLRDGEVVTVAITRQRTDATHRHEFAWLRSAWASLPEALHGEPYAKSPEHLRKYALIHCGYADCREIAVADDDLARQVAAFVRATADDYAVVAASGGAVRVYTAKSQSRRAMDAATFQASKSAILDFIAGLLSVSPETLAAL